MALSSDHPRAAARCGDDAFSRSLGAICPQFAMAKRAAGRPGSGSFRSHVDEVARLLEPWRGARPVTAATFLAGGLMNRNYRVRVGSDDVVLRFYDRDARACAKRLVCFRSCMAVSRCRSVLYVAPSTETVPFVVLEFVDGISMRELKQSGDARGHRRSGTRSRPGAGHARVGSPARRRDPGNSFRAESRATSRSERQCSSHRPLSRSPLLRERLGEPHATRVHDFAWRHDDALSAMSESAGIAHGDFNSANILVRRSAGRWTVAAILDWEFAFEGSIAYDIGNFLRYERASNPRFEPVVLPRPG